MLKFKKIELEDRERVLPFIRKHGYCSAEYCFGNLYIWQSAYQTEYALSNKTLIIRGQYGGKQFYQVPLGGEGFHMAVEELMRENPAGLTFYGVTERGREKLEENFPGEFTFFLHEDKSDYVYQKSDLRDLPGKKYHAKRNYVNRFVRQYGEIRSEPITEENLLEVLAFQEQWLTENLEHGENGLYDENRAVLACLQHFFKLDMFGCLLRVEGKVAAYAVGERLGCQTVVEHFEKATRKIDGCYTVILTQFAKSLGDDIEFINREEDMGLSGLRRAKRSLYPCRMEYKYVGEWKPGNEATAD